MAGTLGRAGSSGVASTLLLAALTLPSAPAHAEDGRERVGPSGSTAPESATRCYQDDGQGPEILGVTASPAAEAVGVSAVQEQTFTLRATDSCGIAHAWLLLERTSSTHGELREEFELSYAGVDDAGVETWSVTLRSDPRNLYDAMAGTWRMTTDAYDSSGNVGTATDTTYLQRAGRLSVNAAPEPVRMGAALTVTGALSRASWDYLAYRGYTYQDVQLQFRTPTGAYATVKTVRTDGSGQLRTTVTASKDGCWRWYFPGTTTTSSVEATGDCVDVV